MRMLMLEILLSCLSSGRSLLHSLDFEPLWNFVGPLSRHHLAPRILGENIAQAHAGRHFLRVAGLGVRLTPATAPPGKHSLRRG